MNDLINGDYAENIKLLIAKGIQVDTIITDPPYLLTSRGTSGTMGGEFWTSDRAKKGKIFNTVPNIKEWLPLCYDILKEGTHIYIMCNDKNLHEYLDTVKKSKFKFVKTIVWVKPNKICGRWYMTQKEHIILARKGKARPINNASSSDVLFTPDFKKQKNDKKNLHDSEKPVELMQILVENSSNENETVLDPFMGIGTTGIACINSNRNFIGIEIDETYFNVAKERIERINNE